MEQSVEVSVDRMSIKFRVIKPRPGRYVNSPKLKIGDIEWCSEFVQRYDGKYSLYLHRSGNCLSPLQVRTYLMNGTDLFLPQTSEKENNASTCIWRNFKSEICKVLPDFEQQSMLSFKVFIHVTHDIEEHPKDKSVQTPANLDVSSGIQSLSQDLSKLLKQDANTHNTDVKLICGDVTFKGHKILLSVRSEVFRAMLGSNMTEGKTGEIRIVDTEADLFGQFLRYLYTGRLEELTVDTATRLYEVGDRYDVQALKRQCGNFLAENLSHDNACGVLSLADRHTDGDLKDAATAYILEQKIPLEDDNWSDFCNDHPVLATKLLNQFCKLLASSSK